jgi:hypothetical protein
VAFDVKNSVANAIDNGNALFYNFLVLQPGFQKGRDIKASRGKGQGAVSAKKGQFASYKEKQTEFHSFRVNKMFSHKF